MKTVVLLTAGIGSRMGKYASVTNKTLLPIRDKAIISHIIEQFPSDTRFIVAGGYKKELVLSYLLLAHPKTNFSFVEVSNFDGPGSGPAHSLSCCKQYINGPFLLIACDAHFEKLNEIPTDKNYVGVAPVNPLDSPAYCNVELDGTRIRSIVDKRHCTSGLAVSGAFYIKDTETFWNGLSGIELSSGWNANEVHAFEIPWVDLGTYDKYQKFYLENSPYDFSKTDEFLYIVNGRVIKWFKDRQIAFNRVQRADGWDMFPHIDYSDAYGFYSYKFVPGKTLYAHVTPDIFEDFMQWMAFNMWSNYDPKKCLTSEMCVDFYHTKTMKRLAAFREKYPDFDPKVINGKEMKIDMDNGLQLVEWDAIFNRDLQQRTAFIHGDLQFDNILHDGEKFKLLDWRQDFAGNLEIGDVYYDIAKLLGGMIIHYDLIKANAFEYHEMYGGSVVNFSMTEHEGYEPLRDKLQHMLPDMIIEQIVTLIFLNMAPLHSAPFDKLLYCLALERLNVLA